MSDPITDSVNSNTKRRIKVSEAKPKPSPPGIKSCGWESFAWPVGISVGVILVVGWGSYIANIEFKPRVDCYLVKEVKSNLSDTIYSVVARRNGEITECERWILKGEHYEVAPITGATPEQREYDRAKTQWDRLDHGKN